jgi:serine/threonine protein kinase
MISKLGHFDIVSEIAEGGMGVIYEAFDPMLNRKVAIKVLSETFARDPNFVESFLREARSAAAISHPNIIQIHAVDQEEWSFYIVMELLRGQTLNKLILSEGRMVEKRVLEIGLDATKALQAAYSCQMIHGDIAPHNIWICEDGSSKILDFGLAKFANVEVKASDQIWGSAYYISPERVGRSAEDFRSDIYSLGASLFEALVGHPPFNASTTEELALMRLNMDPPPLRKLNPGVTKQTESIVNKMLKKNPDLRHPSYDALLQDFHDAYDSLVALTHASKAAPRRTPTNLYLAPVAVPASVQPIKSKFNKFWILGMGGFLILLSVFGALIFLGKKSKSTAIQNSPSLANTIPSKVEKNGESPLSSSSPNNMSAMSLEDLFASGYRLTSGKISLIDPTLKNIKVNNLLFYFDSNVIPVLKNAEFGEIADLPMGSVARVLYIMPGGAKRKGSESMKGLLVIAGTLPQVTRGHIAAIDRNGGTVQLSEGTSFKVAAKTMFLMDDNPSISFENLNVGLTADIIYKTENGVNFARWIRAISSTNK